MYKTFIVLSMFFTFSVSNGQDSIEIEKQYTRTAIQLLKNKSIQKAFQIIESLEPKTMERLIELTEKGTYERELTVCKLEENTLYQANFFPKESFLLKVIGKGFGRHQIRLMMGALIQLGKGEIDLDYISNSLKKESTEVIDYIAPASGLILHKVEF